MTNISKEEIAKANQKLRRNIPSVRRHPLVRDVSDERANDDGVWIYLKAGWNCPACDMNAIHEDTLADAIECLKGAYYDESTID